MGTKIAAAMAVLGLAVAPTVHASPPDLNAAKGPAAAAYTVEPTAVSHTVYTIEPLDYNLFPATPLVLQGAMCKGANKCVKVPTEASLDMNHSEGIMGEIGPISRGAKALNQKLNTDQSVKTVLGYSQGSQIAGWWLRNYSATSPEVSPSNTKFVLLGDPENTYGVPWTPKVPTNTGQDVTEMWIQYDGWADAPSRFKLLAVVNAVWGALFIHPSQYNKVDMNDPSIITWTANGVTYKMVPSERLAILNPLARMGFTELANKLNVKLQPIVESAYDRPSTQAQADLVTAAANPVVDPAPMATPKSAAVAPAAAGRASAPVQSRTAALPAAAVAPRSAASTAAPVGVTKKAPVSHVPSAASVTNAPAVGDNEPAGAKASDNGPGRGQSGGTRHSHRENTTKKDSRN